MAGVSATSINAIGVDTRRYCSRCGIELHKARATTLRCMDCDIAERPMSDKRWWAARRADLADLAVASV